MKGQQQARPQAGVRDQGRGGVSVAAWKAGLAASAASARLRAEQKTPDLRARAWRFRGVPIALVAALLAFLVLAAVRPLLLPDEGRYAGIAWEMLRSGDWITPTLDGLPFFHKPPLYYWITAATMAVLGPSAFAARVAPLAGAALASGAMFLFARRWLGARTARLAAMALLLQPLFALAAQYANLDMLVAGLITATILLLAHAALAHARGEPYRAALIGAYAVAALGVLAKGLIGAVLPALVVGAWLLLSRRWRTLVALLSAPGLLLFLAIAVPWFVAAEARHPGFFDYFFVVQHVQRFAQGGFNNAEPFWFYPALLAVLLVPWWPWMRAGLARASLRDPQQRAIRTLLFAWAALVTLFFSLPESKLVGYILPAMPPLVLWAADAVAQAMGRAREAATASAAPRGWIAAGACGAVFSLAVALALTVRPTASTQELAATLRAQHAAGEPVFMLDAFYFDVPVLARLRAPVLLVDAWSDPAIAAHDNWRRELADGARFAPRRAEAVLITPDRLAQALCEAPVSWVLGAPQARASFAFLGAAREAGSVRGTTLWRVASADPRVAEALGCAGGVSP